jgi:hypothetical protein
MESSDKQSTKAEVPHCNESKRPYVSPVVVRYGTLTEMTRGSSGRGGDAAGKKFGIS